MAGILYLSICVIGLTILGFLSSTVHSVSCFSCNSYYDPNCGDPFDPNTIGIANCSLRPKPEHLAHHEAKLCRKIVQKIEGKFRIVRNCGYIEDTERDDKACVKRSGTHDIQIEYCSCTSDLCNVSKNLRSDLFYVLTSVAVGLSMNVFRNYQPFYSCL